MSFASLFWAQPANADAVADAQAALDSGEQLVIDLIVENEVASLEVSSANELVILAQESLDLANQEIIQKELDVANAQIAYDQNLITEIIYTDSGLTATVYNNAGYNESPPLPGENRVVSVQEVANIDFQWESGSVLGGPAEDVAIKFEGTITASTTGEYQFYGPADDGFMLKINGVTIINDWIDKGGGGTFSQPVILTAGEANTFEAWYYENGGGAWVQLYWTVGGYWQIVPPTAFDTAIVVETKDPNLLLNLEAAQAELAMSLEEQLIAQINLTSAVEDYNLAVETQETVYENLQGAIAAIPALQQALADAIEAAKPIEPEEPENPVIIDPEVPTEEPTVEPTPEPTTPEPTPQPTIPSEEEPAPTPTPSEEPVEEPTENEPEPLPEPEQTSPTEELGELTEVAPEDLTEDQIEQLQELVLSILETAEPESEEYQEALEALMLIAEADDVQLSSELAAIPLLGDVAGAVLELFNNLGNLGADMAPEVRERAEETVIAAVIVGQVAQLATGAAMATASSAGVSGRKIN